MCRAIQVLLPLFTQYTNHWYKLRTQNTRTHQQIRLRPTAAQATTATVSYDWNHLLDLAWERVTQLWCNDANVITLCQPLNIMKNGNMTLCPLYFHLSYSRILSSFWYSDMIHGIGISVYVCVCAQKFKTCNCKWSRYDITHFIYVHQMR